MKAYGRVRRSEGSAASCMRACIAFGWLRKTRGPDYKRECVLLVAVRGCQWKLSHFAREAGGLFTLLNVNHPLIDHCVCCLLFPCLPLLFFSRQLLHR